MTSNKHDFEELDVPASAAKKLGISVATLRKYSLIIEKVTGNSNYFARTKQKARLYHQKDIADLDAFHKLAKNSGLTLQEAARQIYAVSDKNEQKKQKARAKTPNKNELMNTAQVIKLLGALQQTIASQNEAITSLQKQLNRIEKQNQTLLRTQKKLAAPKMTKPVSDDIAAMPDISGIVSKSVPDKPMTREEKRKEIEADTHKSEQEMHAEILNKAKENAKKRASANVHRTLEDMQLQPKREHWWSRFFK